MSAPETAMCAPSLRLGQRTCSTNASGSMIASTNAKRRQRKVNGSAYGTPSFAPMKPVLQSTTKSGGAARDHRTAAAAMSHLQQLLRVAAEYLRLVFGGQRE